MNPTELGNFEGKPHSRDLKLTRTLTAPRELVFEAFTQAKHLTQWWAPRGFTMPSCEVDLRPGGDWKYTFRSPEGWEHHCHAKYLEVDPPKRIVMTQEVPDQDGKPIFRIKHTVTFEERDGTTEVVLEAKVLLANPGSEPYLAGMKEGTNQTLDNLVKYVVEIR